MFSKKIHGFYSHMIVDFDSRDNNVDKTVTMENQTLLKNLYFNELRFTNAKMHAMILNVK